MEKEYININPEERKIESESRMLLGILGDANADRVYFKCQKIVGDDIDLSKLQLYVKYAVSDRRGDKFTSETQIYHCEDVKDCGDYVEFSWRMSSHVFTESGFVAYSILAANGEVVRWNTYPAIGTVGMTVPGGLEEIAEEYSDVITQLLERMDYLEREGVPTELVEQTLNKYLEENPIEIPEKLPNPQKLTFEGAVSAEYDGSGAVVVHISKGQERIEKNAVDTDVIIEPNKLYIFPEMEALNITLSDILDTSIANEYHFVFKSGETATTFALPDTVNVPDGFKVDANEIYEISIMEDCLVYQSWAVNA